METFTSKEQALEMIKAQFSEEEISWIANHLLFSANPQCAEPEAPFTCYNNEDVLEEEETDLVPVDADGVPLTKEQINARIDKAEQDIAEGRVYSYETVMKRMTKFIKTGNFEPICE